MLSFHQFLPNIHKYAFGPLSLKHPTIPKNQKLKITPIGHLHQIYLTSHMIGTPL